jgi:hypothetical protein
MVSFLLSGSKQFSRETSLRFEHGCDGNRAKAHGKTLPIGIPAGKGASAGRER